MKKQDLALDNLQTMKPNQLTSIYLFIVIAVSKFENKNQFTAQKFLVALNPNSTGK